MFQSTFLHQCEVVPPSKATLFCSSGMTTWDCRQETDFKNRLKKMVGRLLTNERRGKRVRALEVRWGTWICDGHMCIDIHRDASRKELCMCCGACTALGLTKETRGAIFNYTLFWSYLFFTEQSRCLLLRTSNLLSESCIQDFEWTLHSGSHWPLKEFRE